MSARNILDEIVEKRKSDIESKGWDFRFEIPVKRTRKIHPFLEEKGVILEVKRASPSKGDIAPNLNSAETAYSYAMAGAGAISCLTESNYFKGTLKDLMQVCDSVDKFETETGKIGPAVLRKDFLIDEKEIEIAYRAGADAVLLISRILPLEKMIKMAEKCQELKITALVELRLEEDVDKLAKVIEKVDTKYIVAGVNSRDLKDFTIDLLTPCAMLNKIKQVLGKNARVIFESGIRTPQSAAFVGSLGFAGMLLGEAAAKNSEIREALVKTFVQAEETPNANFWNKYAAENLQKQVTSKNPLVKICGMTNAEDVNAACELNADLLGFIFWNKSPRAATEEVVKAVRATAKKSVMVGVIVDPDDEEAKTAITLVKEGFLDVIQLHTMNCARKFLANSELRKLPHYAAINISKESDTILLEELFDLGEPRVLIDAQSEDKIGGTGKQISSELVSLAQKKYKLWLAGGLNPQNVNAAVNAYKPELIDCASGLEEFPGKKNLDKMSQFMNNYKLEGI